MRQALFKATSLVVATLLLGACSSVTNVLVDHQFPDVNALPRDVKASILFDETFSHYKAEPNKKTIIDMGRAQLELLTRAFRGLFSEVEFISSREQVSEDSQLLIVPQVREVQVTTPSETYLNVYEVWIKYSLEIEARDGVAIESWFMPAYGKTPDSFMLSKTEAIESATNIALRDAGAKLLLDFYRIPSVSGWYQQQLLEQQQSAELQP
jgi:hypothetical protein